MAEEMAFEKKKKSKKSKKKHLNKEEDEGNIITKDADLMQTNDEENVLSKKSKKKSKKNKKEKNEVEAHEVENNVEVEDATVKSKKSKKRKRIPEPEQTEQNEDEDKNEELDPTNPQIKKTESIRAMKRKKHEQLLVDKKNKSELATQQKCLNYLSQWKHNRDGWKFQKLSQIWLQQNMFDEARVPDKFWDTLVEYFNNAKGKSRENIIKQAVKVIDEYDSSKKIDEKTEEKEEEESEEKAEEDDGESTVNVKYNRARHIVQHLQE